MHAHVYTDAHTHTGLCTLTTPHTHAHVYTDAHMHTRDCTHSLHHTSCTPVHRYTLPAYTRAHVTVPTCTTHTDCTQMHMFIQVHIHTHTTHVHRDMHMTYAQSVHTQVHTQMLSHTHLCAHTCTPVCTHVLTHTEFTGWDNLTSISCCPGHSHRLLTAVPTEALPPTLSMPCSPSPIGPEGPVQTKLPSGSPSSSRFTWGKR